MTTTQAKRTYTNRKIFSLPDDYTLRSNKNRSSTATRKNEDIVKLVKYIDESIIGKNSTFQGPFGRRKVVYCDYVASGRSLQFIEEYIIKEVLPSYGNTHASTNITSLQSTLFRQEARDIIRNAVNASDDDVVIFAGHGSTAAVQKLLSVLGLHRGDVEPPIVFAGSCDHHTNLLPWREIGAQVVKINETKEGHLDLNDLENQLQMHYHDGKMLIGCFSAVSNITGIETDTVATTLILHQYGALSFWDYATAAPYTQIDMNPEFPELSQPTVFKDAIFFSGHKFIGGLQTPGILIAKKSLFRRTIPDYCIQMLDHHFTSMEQYVQDTELRQEGATAAVVESIRAALAVQLKETVGVTSIMSKAEKISRNMLAHIRTIPEILLLGSGCQIQKRLPIFSFMVRHPRGTFLHHNFVCAVLNDVFGIQGRAGCACAGPYAQDLLGIDDDLAAEYESILTEDRVSEQLQTRYISKHSNLEVLRPGFTRISLPYCMSEPEVTYVMEAIKMVATEGWKLLPQYVLSQETGEWRHHTNMMCKDRKWLSSIRYTDGKMLTNERRISGPGTFPQSYADCLQTARNIFNRARKMAQKHPVSEQCLMLDAQTEKLRWFMLPSEAQDLLLGNSQNVKHDVPFQPVTFFGSRHSFTEQQSPKQRTHNATPYGSPRHFSLPVMDDKSPFYYPLPPSTPTGFAKYMTHDESPRTVQPVQFAVGGAVTVSATPKLKKVAEINSPLFARNRCYSLGSENSSPPSLSPQQIPVRIGGAVVRNGHYVSHNDLVAFEQEVVMSPQNSITHTSGSSGSGSDCSIVGRASPNLALSRHNTDNLQAYLKEVTKELATEIKSEIRGVISCVEDVLESTDSVDMSSLPFMAERHNSSSDESRGDSVSANDVCEYLVGVSKEMASEVKSEIREMVSAVDIQLDKPSRQSRFSSERLQLCTGAIPKHSRASQENDNLSTESIVNPLNKSHSSSKLSDDHSSLDLDIKAHPHVWPTINSVSSQDSGINLSFQEQDSVLSQTNINSDHKQRSSSESSTCRRLRKNNGVFPSPRTFYSQRPVGSDIQETKDSTSDLAQQIDERLKFDSPDDKKAWYTPPKNIWKPVLEATNEFDMILHGDKVLICVAGDISSLTLLHTLLQYQYYLQNKGIDFTIGATAIYHSKALYDTTTLVSYLESLNIKYYQLDEVNQNLNISESTDETLAQYSTTLDDSAFINSKIQAQLYTLSKKEGFNVLAVGHHLDDLAEEFVKSIFQNGKLQTMKALCVVKDHNLRIIRPLIYVREESIRQFVESRNISIIIDKSKKIQHSPIKEKTEMRSFLSQQETMFPNLFANIRSVLQPLISNDITADDGKTSNDDSSRSSDRSSNVFFDCEKE